MGTSKLNYLDPRISVSWYILLCTQMHRQTHARRDIHRDKRTLTCTLFIQLFPVSTSRCKKWDIPVEKVYNKTQRQKFAWAIDMADETFVF